MTDSPEIETRLATYGIGYQPDPSRVKLDALIDNIDDLTAEDPDAAQFGSVGEYSPTDPLDVILDLSGASVQCLLADMSRINWRARLSQAIEDELMSRLYVRTIRHGNGMVCRSLTYVGGQY